MAHLAAISLGECRFGLCFHCHRETASLMRTESSHGFQTQGYRQNKWANEWKEKPENGGIPWLLSVLPEEALGSAVTQHYRSVQLDKCVCTVQTYSTLTHPLYYSSHFCDGLLLICPIWSVVEFLACANVNATCVEVVKSKVQSGFLNSLYSSSWCRLLWRLALFPLEAATYVGHACICNM